MAGRWELFVSRGKYANEILRRFFMESNKPMETPLAGKWRKDDATSGEVMEANVYRPTKLYWKSTKHVLRYLRGTTQFELWYIRTKGVKLQGFTNAYWVGSPSNKKKTFGGIFTIGSTTISWYNRKHRSVALISTEAKYMATIQEACEAILMRKILIGLFGQ
eukprot:PITA_25182